MSSLQPRKFFIQLLLCVCSAPALVHASPTPFKDCPQNFFQGVPPASSKSMPRQLRALCFSGFAVMHSGESKTPVYVAQHLSYARLKAAQLKRTDRFYEESRLPSAERARLVDYKARDSHGQAYDRGHQAPAADMDTPAAMAQSFSLANMAPQVPELNRGPWARSVEQATRKYVLRTRHDVYVLTGPVFQGPRRTLGPSQVWIPSHFYKLVYDPTRGEAWAFWLENSAHTKAGRPLNYAELVQKTGMELIPLLPKR